MQAVSMDVKGAAISGVDPDRMNLITWGISGALGAVAGVFFASYTQLYPGMWVAPLIISVAVVIVGGIGSIWGTLIVAHIIGFMEVISTTYIAAELRGVFTMALIILVLVIRPQGLFGTIHGSLQALERLFSAGLNDAEGQVEINGRIHEPNKVWNRVRQVVGP